MSNSDLNVGENKGFPFSYENSSLGATQPTLLANPGFIEKRQHKRSISEQISNPRHSHTLRHRHRRQSRGNLLDAGGVGRTINPERGSLFEGYMGEEDQEYYSDYVPHSVEGITRSGKSSHFRQALKLKNRLRRHSRSAIGVDPADDFNSSSGSTFIVTEDRPHRHKKSFGGALTPPSFSDVDEMEAEYGLPVNHSITSDPAQLNTQRKQSRIRHSIAGMFQKMKRSMSIPSIENENEVNQRLIWGIMLKLNSAKLRAKENVYVRIVHNDVVIDKTRTCTNTNNPKWNEQFKFKLDETEKLLELQLVQKHSIRNDRILGRSFIDLFAIETERSIEVPIRGVTTKLREEQVGTFLIDVAVEEMLDFPADIASLSSADTQAPSEYADSASSPKYARKPFRHRMAKHLSRHKLRYVKSRSVLSESVEDTNERQIQQDSSFVFRPELSTKVMLERTGVKPHIAWRPFIDWPGNRTTLPHFVTLLHKTQRIFELRSPRLDWPMEFFSPMSRVMLPSVEPTSPESQDLSTPARIVNSGILIIHLIGARGLRAVPHVKDVTPREECPTGKGASPETCAASIVAYHWAAKALTAPPKPCVLIEYGDEKQECKSSKNTCNPDFLEEFEFKIFNGSPRFVHIIVRDEENQAGTGGIPRSSLLGESMIDLTELPLEVTQRVELQLSKNTNEARLLMYVTITGLTTVLKQSLPLTQNGVPSETNFRQSTLSVSEFPSTASAASPTEIGAIPSIAPESVELTFKSALASNSPRADQRLPDNVTPLLLEHFGFKNSFHNQWDIGWLKLKIICAVGTAGKSGGRNESLCMVDYLNTRLKTHTVIKNERQAWNRTFVIPITDIHEAVRISVCDVDKGRAVVIARVAIHLLRIANGESKWYALKTPDLRNPTKGSILLEITLYFNQLKAALRSFKPRETRYRALARKQKEIHLSELRLLQQRYEHVKPLLDLIRWWGQLFDDWWSWKNPLHSIFGLICYQLLIYNFKAYFIPLYMIMILLKNRFYSPTIDVVQYGIKTNKNVARLASPQEHEIYKRQYDLLEQLQKEADAGEDESRLDYQPESSETGSPASPTSPDGNDRGSYFEAYQLAIPDLSDTLEEEEEKITIASKPQIKKTIKTKYNRMKETTASILDIVENTASFYERMEGLFKWRIPWISWLAVVVLIIFTILLFFFPLKIILMIWGLNKFTKAILRPNAIKHNQLMDLLSRVPNLLESDELIEFRPDAFSLSAVNTRVKAIKK